MMTTPFHQHDHQHTLSLHGCGLYPASPASGAGGGVCRLGRFKRSALHCMHSARSRGPIVEARYSTLTREVITRPASCLSLTMPDQRCFTVTRRKRAEIDGQRHASMRKSALAVRGAASFRYSSGKINDLSTQIDERRIWQTRTDFFGPRTIIIESHSAITSLVANPQYLGTSDRPLLPRTPSMI